MPDSPRVVIYQPVGAMTHMAASNISSELDVVVVHNKEAYDHAALGLPFKQDAPAEDFKDVEQTQGSFNRTV